MPSIDAARTTQLLNLYLGGDRSVERDLMASVYSELHSLADAFMRHQCRHSLQPTALINEAWMRLMCQDELEFGGRRQFFQLASRIMRSVLVDHGRRAGRDKRGGGRAPSTLDEAAGRLEVGAEVGLEEIVDLEAGLTELEAIDPTLVRVVEMRFFGGLNHPEIADALGLSLRTVEGRWRSARAWLHARLSR